jgi:hypothetical protein
MMQGLIRTVCQRRKVRSKALLRIGAAKLTEWCWAKTEANDTLLVCTPPHMAADIKAAVKICDTIRVRGIRPRRADIIAAVALPASNGETIIDSGPGHEDGHEPRHRDNKLDRLEAQGAVRLSRFGPKGRAAPAVSIEDRKAICVSSRWSI